MWHDKLQAPLHTRQYHHWVLSCTTKVSNKAGSTVQMRWGGEYCMGQSDDHIASHKESRSKNIRKIINGCCSRIGTQTQYIGWRASPVSLSLSLPVFFPLPFLPPSLTCSLYGTMSFCSIQNLNSCLNWFDQYRVSNLNWFDKYRASSLIQWVLSVVSNEVSQWGKLDWLVYEKGLVCLINADFVFKNSSTMSGGRVEGGMLREGFKEGERKREKRWRREGGRVRERRKVDWKEMRGKITSIVIKCLSV